MYCNFCQNWDIKVRNNSKVWNFLGCVVIWLDVVNRYEQFEMYKDVVFKEMVEDYGIDVVLDKLQKKEFDVLKDV